MPPLKGAATRFSFDELPTGCFPLSQPSGVVIVHVYALSNYFCVFNKIGQEQQLLKIITNLMFCTSKVPVVVLYVWMLAILDVMWCRCSVRRWCGVVRMLQCVDEICII